MLTTKMNGKNQRESDPAIPKLTCLDVQSNIFFVTKGSM